MLTDSPPLEQGDGQRMSRTPNSSTSIHSLLKDHDNARKRLSSGSSVSNRGSSNGSENNSSHSSSSLSPDNQHNNDNSFDLWVNILSFLRMILASIYLLLIILTIPLAFEIGGLDCGLSYSLTILIVYFVLATLRVAKYNILTSILYYLQHLMLPSLLFLFLNIFNQQSQQLEQSDEESIYNYIWWSTIIKTWKLFLINSTPLFTILEGFCSLLVIQMIGKIIRVQINSSNSKKSDNWNIINLVLSGIIISICIYFIIKFYNYPIEIINIGLITSSLIGSILTITLFITIFGIYSGKASSTLECSLVFAYITKCLYELFPELNKRNFNNLIKIIINEFNKLPTSYNLINDNFFVKLNNFITNYDSKFNFKNNFKFFFNHNLFFTDFLLNSFESLFNFFSLSMSNLTIPILITLAYRIFVFFAATKIIPILQPQAQVQLQDSTKKTKTKLITKSINQRSKIIKLIYLYSPCIIITVYTNLMIQYNEELNLEFNRLFLVNWIIELFNGSGTQSDFVVYYNNSQWQFWQWINIFSILLLYTLELFNSNSNDDDSIYW